MPVKFLTTVRAGFPSPGRDHKERRIDFNALLNAQAPSVYPAEVIGDSMIDACIPHGAIAVVDFAIEPRNNSIVIATLNGEDFIKHIVNTKDGTFLLPANSKYNSIRITDDMDFSIWGTVTHIVIPLLNFKL